MREKDGARDVEASSEVNEGLAVTGDTSSLTDSDVWDCGAILYAARSIVNQSGVSLTSAVVVSGGGVDVHLWDGLFRQGCTEPCDCRGEGVADGLVCRGRHSGDHRGGLRVNGGLFWGAVRHAGDEARGHPDVDAAGAFSPSHLGLVRGRADGGDCRDCDCLLDALYAGDPRGDAECEAAGLCSDGEGIGMSLEEDPAEAHLTERD